MSFPPPLQSHQVDGFECVSVVMAVYDKPEDVAATVLSVLAQHGIELELIVVNDGASDEVLRTLAQYDDPRLRIIHQPNQGLTRALINGCAHASHEFIARVDAGDLMLEGRLSRQAERMRQRPDVGLIACWVRTCTDDDLFMYDERYTAQELRQGVGAASVDDFKSPVHASVMFRRSTYRNVGGYRTQFYFTQDCDLWSRMSRVADIDVIENVLQQCVFSTSGISGRYRDLQKQLVALVMAANALWQQHHDQVLSDEAWLDQQQALLDKAETLRPCALTASAENTGDFSANYFIASVLSHKEPVAAMKYWRKVLAERPWHVKSRIKALRCWWQGRG